MTKVAILTNMMDFNPGYSLTGIIKDQTLMLKKHGVDVHLYVNEQFNQMDLIDFEHITVHQKIPFAHLTDYTSKTEISEDHKKTIIDMKNLLIKDLSDFDVIFTHDFVFTGWFLPYGLGCIEASKILQKPRWMHWIHSVPSVMRDWWFIRNYGAKHKLVFPNAADQLRVAEQYRGGIENVIIIPHIKDIRTFQDFHRDTNRLIDSMPSILSSTVMQVFPAGSDRLCAKGIEQVIKIFGFIKGMGNNVCLLIANQWATGRQRKECLGPYEDLAKRVGLVPYVDIAFTSDLHSDWANGLPKHMVRELFQCSNLFVFPTREESFGLVVPEAALCGVLPVLNKSLESQTSISLGTALYFDFGSFTRPFQPANEDVYYNDIAKIILGRMLQSETLKTKTMFKNLNNMDYLYNKYYAPFIAESSLWGA